MVNIAREASEEKRSEREILEEFLSSEYAKPVFRILLEVAKRRKRKLLSFAYIHLSEQRNDAGVLSGLLEFVRDLYREAGKDVPQYLKEIQGDS